MESVGGGGGYLESAEGGEISSRGPASIDYRPVPAAGFKILPAVIRSRLVNESVIGRRPLCASCLEIKLKRRADGTHYQSGTAWWGDRSRAVLIEGQREMKLLSGNKFSPSGTWRVSGVIHHLQGGGGPEVSTWQFSTGAIGQESLAPPVMTKEALDLLPPEVAAPVRGGFSDVWMRTSPSNAAEFLTAVKVSDGVAFLLEANRTAPSESTLSRAEWKLTTLRARIERSEEFGFECGKSPAGPRPIRRSQGAVPLLPGT